MNTKRIQTIIKTILFAIILFVDITLIFSSPADDPATQGEDITYEAKQLEKNYYEKDYVSMMEIIERNSFHKEDVKVYKEAMDAYILKMRCGIYAKAGSKVEYENAFAKLQKMAANCEPENEKLFAQFVEQVK